MPRYFAESAYRGTSYAGWQRQPNALSIQEVIEDKLSTIFNQPTTIVGCGRTDAGVHASQYYFHFDTSDETEDNLAHRLNRMLPRDIAVSNIEPVHPDAHARFDATSRAYGYYLVGSKSVFNFETRTYYPAFNKLDHNILDACAALIKSYDEFIPFCKTGSDAGTMKCSIMESYWTYEKDHYKYTIKANRFLRGMVRLVVGISLRAAIGEVPVSDIEYALKNQTRLTKSWSAPAEGLFLEAIEYDSSLRND